jgi:nitrite reductase/ring-hydroxylating ferredoxin subunit
VTNTDGVSRNNTCGKNGTVRTCKKKARKWDPETGKCSELPYYHHTVVTVSITLSFVSVFTRASSQTARVTFVRTDRAAVSDHVDDHHQSVEVAYYFGVLRR